MSYRAVVFFILICGAAHAAFATPQVLDWPRERNLPGMQMRSSNGPLSKPIRPQSGQYAVSEDGVVCTFEPGATEVVIYPKLGSDGSVDGAIHAEIADGVTAIAYKAVAGKSYFLVAVGNQGGVTVLDSHSGVIVQKIQTRVSMIASIAAPANAAVPFAYYTDKMQARVGRIDFRSMRDDGVIELPPTLPRNTLDIAISPDGALLYAWESFMAVNHSWVLGLQNETSRQWTLIANGPDNISGLFPSPDGQFVATAGKMLSPKLEEISSPAITGRIITYSRTMPFIFTAADDGTIDVISTNTNTSVSTTPPLFPTTVPPVSTGNHRRLRTVAPLSLYFDDTHHKLIAVDHDHVALISLDDLHASAEPVARVNVEAEPNVPAGRPWVATLHKLDPTIEIKLTSPPAGMTLEKDKIRWTPSLQDRGSHTIGLAIFAGKNSRTQQLTVNVLRGGIVIPFTPQILALSPDGKLAVAALLAFNEGRRGGDDPVMARVVVLDLQKQTIVCQRTLLTQLVSVAIDSRYVYIVKQRSTAINLLSVSDLSDQKRVFTNGVINRVASTGSRLYALQDGQMMKWYKLPDLTPGLPTNKNTKIDEAMLHDLQSQLQVTPPNRVDGGWYDNGVIFDEQFAVAREIIQDDFFLMAGKEHVQERSWGTTPPPIGPWHSWIDDAHIQQETARSSKRVPLSVGSNRDILQDRPLLAQLMQYTLPDKATSGWKPPNICTQIELYKLAGGDPIEPIILRDAPRANDPMRSQDSLQFLVGPHVMVAAINDEVFAVPTSEIPNTPLPIPMSVTPPDRMILVRGDRPSTIPLQVDNGKKPFTFTLSEDIPGVDIDASTGELKIDPAPLRDELVDDIASLYIVLSPQVLGQDLRLDPSEMVNSYRAVCAARVQQLTGKPSTGVPVEILVTVVTQDSDHQTARSMMGFLVDMPLAGLVDALDEELHPTQPPPAPKPAPPPAPADRDDSGKRT